MANPTHKLIASYAVGSGGSASIDFTSIPSTYTDLILKVSTRKISGSGYMLIDFNGLSTANFAHKVVEGNGATGYSFVSGNTNYATGAVGAGDTASTFSNTEFYIPNYAGSNNKTVSIDGVTENNAATAYADLEALSWSNTAAITRITLTLNSGSFAELSSAQLYGIKNS